MPPTDILTALQWCITLSGVVALYLARLNWIAACTERRAVKNSGQNGCLAAKAQTHLWLSSVQLVKAGLSCAGGVVLIVLPDFVAWSGVVAGLMCLSCNCLLIGSLAIEEWARQREERHHAAKGDL